MTYLEQKLKGELASLDVKTLVVNDAEHRASDSDNVRSNEGRVVLDELNERLESLTRLPAKATDSA